MRTNRYEESSSPMAAHFSCSSITTTRKVRDRPRGNGVGVDGANEFSENTLGLLLVGKANDDCKTLVTEEPTQS